MADVGTGFRNAVPGAVFTDDALTSPAGVEPKWQFSQVVDDGMCDEAPGAAEGGITTIDVIPVNEAPVIVGPWQVTHPLVTPA